MSEDELLEYEESFIKKEKKAKPVTSHTAFFKDFLLRDELNAAIQEAAFEHPSEVQQLCIPKAILGTDILCQAKSGTGKTGVFVLSTLQQIQPIEKETSVLVIVHTKEMAQQVREEYIRFSKHFPGVTVEAFYGGMELSQDIKRLESGSPTIFIGTPGRTLDLLNRRVVYFRHIKHLVIDECDQCITDLKMRHTIQKIIYQTPRDKQVMMYTATLNAESKETCLLFLNKPHEVYIGEESKLTLHGLTQMYVRVTEENKKKKLEEVLDTLTFSQVVIFVKDKGRAAWLCRYLKERGFPSIDIHAGMLTSERIKRFRAFKALEYRVLVTTNLMSRGIDIQEVNIVINYDMPEDPETYLHRVGRAGRFETVGKAITFVADKADSAILNQVQARFEVSIKDMEKNAAVEGA